MTMVNNRKLPNIKQAESFLDLLDKVTAKALSKCLEKYANECSYLKVESIKILNGVVYLYLDCKIPDNRFKLSVVYDSSKQNSEPVLVFTDKTGLNKYFNTFNELCSYIENE